MMPTIRASCKSAPIARSDVVRFNLRISFSISARRSVSSGPPGFLLLFILFTPLRRPLGGLSAQSRLWDLLGGRLATLSNYLGQSTSKFLLSAFWTAISV